MGFFDLFMNEEQKIAKHQRKLTSKDVQPDEREGAARALAALATPVALLALLSRFDMKLEHQLNDQREKDFVYGLLAGVGAPAREPLRNWLLQCKQVALPLRLSVELEGIEGTVGNVAAMLEHERKKDDFKPEKKSQILVWLAEHKIARAGEIAAPFLHDFDEGVRYIAAEAMMAGGSEVARPALAARLLDPKEESNRLKMRIADAFVQRRWTIDAADGAALPPPYRIKDGRVVAG